MIEGNGAEKPFVSQLIDLGQTAVLDRGYQSHYLLDQWQDDVCYFFRRIKGKRKKVVLQDFPLSGNTHIFFDAQVLLGTPSVNQTKKPVRLVGYTVADIQYWVAADRYDLSAERVALAYKLRGDIEKFFAWWKRHLNVYHLFARSKNGLMVQILSGLITYLLLAIYCHEEHQESVSIRRVRQLRNSIRNEIIMHARKKSTVRRRKQKKKCPQKIKKEMKHPDRTLLHINKGCCKDCLFIP